MNAVVATEAEVRVKFAEHAGVTSGGPPPSGKSIVNVSVDPEMVPVNVPLLRR